MIQINPQPRYFTGVPACRGRSRRMLCVTRIRRTTTSIAG
jgi:hypothetical protein